ncbi:hypothetical protein PRUPE_7G042100 [Prunus persica]|uniref:WAT1-related protein n=1 Tax=Prunus persica TaxID=3760 RepID=A0A251N6K3_PRUPE|nr:hypothetical protein PRUPE_7G042100 [Prunus persica]
MSLSSYYLYIRYLFFRKTSSIVLGKVKIIGIVMGIGGAMVFSFYKGKEINMWSTHVDLLRTHGEPYKAAHKRPQSLLWGCMLSLGGCVAVSYALWFIVQASIQYVVLAYCVERDGKQWKLVLTASYLGIMISGLAVTLMTWACLLVTLALAGSFLLDEKLHTGNILGLLIVAGLHAILWANSKDKSDSQPTSIEEMPIHTIIAQA